MTESTFRIKKSRDNSKQELIGGTLDSVHQQVLSKLKEDIKQFAADVINLSFWNKKCAKTVL